MSSQPDVPLPADTWVDITTAISASVGDDLIVQNIGGIQIRVDTDATEPPSADIGLYVNPKNSAQAITTALEKVWARAIGENSIIHAEVL